MSRQQGRCVHRSSLTSSYTKQENCVEVADNSTTGIMVGDTKDRSAGTIAPRVWVRFTAYAETHEV
ncbi:MULTISPECIES: DUF397 domain-containing protein [Streptomyces]|uniref:DUF397 domain-containing protein n=1 Tax=Streptomyces TaxID=1883 RepID=UPI00099CF274|nr:MULTISPECIES: DUF397 domain-containing protein [Streptomyces]